MSGLFGKKTETKNYSFKGIKNVSAFPKTFLKIVRMKQAELKEYLRKVLAEYYAEVVSGDGFLYAKGTMPVCLTAHMDTVHPTPVRDFYGYYDRKEKRNVISSPQGIGGDDRCGVYMILAILKKTNFRPTILFCEDEEVGGVGSSKFLKTVFAKELDNMKFFIELDRGNGKDLVFYDDENTEFHKWCEQITGYKWNWGTFSDISHLCPNAGVSGVNISCGYYNAHKVDEYVVLEEMVDGINAAIKLLNASKEVEQFEYIESFLYRYGYGYGKTSSLYDMYDEVTLTFVFNGGKMETVTGLNEFECFGQFLFDHPNLSFNEIEEYWDESDYIYGEKEATYGKGMDV